MKTIGKYTIRGLLGRGGMGSVFLVQHPQLRTLAALKLLNPTEDMALLLGMQECRRRFMDEARAMARLDHPNVARVWDMDEDVDAAGNRRLFFVMDYVCANLGEAIGETAMVEEPTRPMRPDMAVDYTLQALSGLARLHDAGVVHRDVKPFNMLINTHDTLQLIDFGLSRLRGETQARLPGQMKVGSPYYAAPEQEASPEKAGPAADLFSLGVTLHRLLTGELPGFWRGQEQRVDPSSLHPDLDGEWDAFFATALHADPGKRFGDARVMAAELRRLLQGWREAMDKTCTLPEFSMAGRLDQPALPLRAKSIKAGPKDGGALLGLSKNGRPQAYMENDFHGTDKVVEDRATGLVWQRAGSVYSLDWNAAQDYAARLDAEGFAGRRGWRLPTVTELCSLLEPAPELGDMCVGPLFSQEQSVVWSTDRKTFAHAWKAHLQLGYIGAANMLCPLHVRAVCPAH